MYVRGEGREKKEERQEEREREDVGAKETDRKVKCDENKAE